MSEEAQAPEDVKAPEQEPEKEQEVVAQPDHSWVPKRISEITAARRAAEARASELEAEVNRLKSGVTHSDTVSPVGNQNLEQLARAYAEKMVRDQSESNGFNQKIQSINEAGAKEFGQDFEKSVENLRLAGVGGQDFLKVLTNVPKAEAVVTWLGKSENLNEAMRIASLDPVHMGIELTKMSTKAAKDLSKQISKAPAPIEPLHTSSTGGSEVEPDLKDTDAWIKWRQTTKKTRR
jgi:hypothetical protein